jgi:hypothetical protein
MNATKQNRIMFGYDRNALGQITEYSQQATVVKTIFGLYLNGSSLEDIAKALEKVYHYPSPTNKQKWNRQTIVNILSNEKYTGSAEYPEIINSKLFEQAVDLRKQRSNLDHDMHRRAARYSSSDILFGIIVCGECGKNYRRITKHNSEIIWRCANRVEYGKKVCRRSPTVSDDIVKATIVQCLKNQGYQVSRYMGSIVLEHIEKIIIQSDGLYDFILK